MPNLPVDFSSHAFATGDFSTPWKISSGQNEALCSVPGEFGGAGGGFSPEDLFLQALINCFTGTFKVYAKASKVIFANISVCGTLKVDRDSAGKIRMTKCFLDISVAGAEKPDRVRTLVDKALREGFILNSVTTEVETNLRINEAERPAHL